MAADFETIGYNITDDPDFLHEQSHMTPALKSQMQELHFVAQQGKQSGYERLQSLIGEHPKNPQIKNYLSVWHNARGETQLATDVNRWIVEEHPSYLFGKINLAFEYFSQGEFEQMPEILGKGFDLKSLYPDRDTFHIGEVTAMFRAAVIYYCSVDDYEQAEIRLNIMLQVAPGFPDTVQTQEFFQSQAMMKDGNGLDTSGQIESQIQCPKQRSTTKTDAPKFKHSEITALYEYEVEIKGELLLVILNLPRKTLIEDLELVLADSMERYSHFLEMYARTRDVTAVTFAFHSLLLLSELKADKSLENILTVLSQSDQYVELYFGDLLPSCVWRPILARGANSLEELKEFVQRSGVFGFSKLAVAKALEQLVLHEPERRSDVTKWFADVFNFYLSCKPADNVSDQHVNSFMIDSVGRFKGKELLPTIKKFFDQDLVDLKICGSYQGFADNIEAPLQSDTKYSRLSIVELYEELYESSLRGSEDFASALNDLLFSDSQRLDDFEPHANLMGGFLDTAASTPGTPTNNTPLVKPAKTGRNEPCPCGSGKKHKKCCLN